MRVPRLVWAVARVSSLDVHSGIAFPIEMCNYGDPMPSDVLASQARHLLVLVGEDGWTLDLPAAGTVSIGRGEGCQVRVNDPSVSRRHALLHVGASLMIEDLGSANGTMIRDRAEQSAPTDTLSMRHLVGKKAEISVGDTLLLGTARIVVRCAPSPDLPTSRVETVEMEPAMLGVYAQAKLAAPTPLSIILTGETGVGKEVLARTIHSLSSRSAQPFLALNCAALSDTLLESELFGHEKGAFTGALQVRRGLFETATGGTILLDEVGELAPSAQAKLLRVIEEQAITRLGSNCSRPVDTRLIAATNRDLEAECRAGRFRQDLYIRLNGLTLWIPPLRERSREIRSLAHTLLSQACRQMERATVPCISEACLDCLQAYGWPGNIRELRNIMARAAVLCGGDTILVEHLPLMIQRHCKYAQCTDIAELRGGATRIPVGTAARSTDPSLPTELRSIERARIVDALMRFGGVQGKAAQALGISRGTLVARIEEYGLPRPRKRSSPPKA